MNINHHYHDDDDRDNDYHDSGDDDHESDDDDHVGIGRCWPAFLAETTCKNPLRQCYCRYTCLYFDLIINPIIFGKCVE